MSQTIRRTAGIGIAGVLAVASGGVGWVTGGGAGAAPTPTGSIVGLGYSSGGRSGVFRDVDADGTWDAGEPGQGGITVTATCVADTGTDPSSFDDVYAAAVSTVTSDSGAFTLDGPNVRGQCRVEFSIPTALQTFLQPGVATEPATPPHSAGSFVQFVDSFADPTVTAAVHNAAGYTGSGSATDVIAVRSVPGASDVSANTFADTLDTVYRIDSALSDVEPLAQADDTGSIWGIAWEPTTETLFAAAALRRHAGIGPAGPDAIYALGADVPAAWAEPFAAVDTDGGAVPTDTDRGLGDADVPSDDDLAFELAGTLGWGDLDITEDGRTLYGVNLMSREIQPIDVATKTALPPITIPDPACTNGTPRPWGLEIHDGIVYVGVVCDAATGDAGDLAAFVYAYNPTDLVLPVAGLPAGLGGGTWSSNLVADGAAAPGIQLDHAKGCAADGAGCGWNPWTSTYDDADFNTTPGAAIHPQPILSDIEIDDDGSMILAFTDRTSLQFGHGDVRPQSDDQTADLDAVSGGDVLRAARPTGAGSFVLENDGSVARGVPLGGGVITGASNGQGPGGGEVYSHETFLAVPLEETGLGSLGKAAGSSEYLMSIVDPFEADTGGIGSFPVDGAARVDAIELYDNAEAGGGSSGAYDVSLGMGDIEIATRPAPVEVGNRVWLDDNANGIQDPGEAPIEGVEVRLTIDGQTYIATTDADGNYLFSSEPRTGATTAPLLAGSAYRFDAVDDAATITIADVSGDAQQPSLAGTTPTEPNDATANALNVAGNNANDSDGVPDGTSVSVIFTLGSLAGTNDTNAVAGDAVEREGYNRHLYDFGFVPRVSLGNSVWFDTDNDTVLDAGEEPIPGVAVELFLDANANGAIDPGEQTPVAYDTTDAAGLYYFDQFTEPDGSPLATPRNLAPGNYVVGVAAENFVTGPLAGTYSSGTSMNGTGIVSENLAGDPDDDVNATDDGTAQSIGFYAGGVLSGPVTVTYAAEPEAEESGAADNNGADVTDGASNLTVDFGFYRIAIGNVVWVDDGSRGGDDDDGLRNGDEPGLDGVPVRLYAADGVTEIRVGPDGVLGTDDDGPGGVLTGGGGFYTFDGLPEGTYVVQIDAPAGYRSSTDPATGATPLAANSDDNGTGTGPGTISSQPFTMEAGPSDSNVVDPSTGTTSTTWVDFGLVTGYDLTLVKTVTSAGPYVAGAPAGFSLAASNLGPGVALDGFTVTDRLPAGLTYTAVAATGAEWTCDAPAGLDVTCTWEGPTPGLGNDVLVAGASAPPIAVEATVDDPPPTTRLVNHAVVKPSPAQSIAETNPVGTTPDEFEDGNPATGSNNDDSASISPVPVYSLGDLVWVDADRDGRFGETEAPLPGVIVELLDGVGNPAVDAFGAPVPPAVTDVNGRYQFDDLATGDFVVRFTLPVNAVWTAPDAGDDGLDSDALFASPDAPTADTAVVTLADTPTADADTSPFARAVTDPTIDAGIVPLVSLGDLVWVDADGDGGFDPSEAPLAGVVVELLDGDGGAAALDPLGNAVPATVTDADGRYEFTGLLPGEYRVRFTLPAGYAWTVADTGDDGLDSDALAATPVAPTATTDVVDLRTTSVFDPDNNVAARTVTNPTIDAGVVPVVSLGDLVWLDADGDGQFDPGETPLPAVPVRLLDAAGDPATDADGVEVAPTTTDADGRYSFENLLPGDYRVAFGLPAGYAWTVSNTGDDGLDSDAAFATRLDPEAVTEVFTLTSTPVPDPDTDPSARAVTDPTIDAGVVPLVSLGDVVWIDADRDGQYDSSELPAPFVQVRLLDAAGVPAVGADGAVVAGVGTDADGRYSFEGLLPGTYRVEFTLPDGFAWTSPNAGGDDGQDSDAIAGMATAPTATSPLVDLTPTPVADSDPRGSARTVTDPTIDAGVVPVVSLGDVVWIDADHDGQYDLTESPIEGVTVTLTDGAGGPAADVDGNPVDPVSTDVDGRYAFGNLLPGEYRVTFELPAGFRWTASDLGDDGLDSDALADAPDAPTATTDTISLTATPVADPDTRDSARGVTNPTIDAGVVPVLSLGDLVWVDIDQDGQFDPTEAPLADVTVRLLDEQGDPVDDANGDPVAPALTDADGRYSFEDLLPGSYVVEFTLPSGFAWTVADAGDDGLDSDAVADSPLAPTARTEPFVLASTPVVDPDSAGLPVTDPTIDAGVVPVLSLGDLVWVDADQDGQFDPTEDPIKGVAARLTDADGNPVTGIAGETVAPTATDADGRYSFEGLLPGDYRVEFDLPVGYAWTVANSGGDGLDSDAVAPTRMSPIGVTDPYVLEAAPVTDPDGDVTARDVTNPTIDAGVVPVLSLGDLVWVDADQDGTYDDGERPIAGVGVRLLDTAGDPVLDAEGDEVAPTVTNAEGRYAFSDLVPGTYQVEFTLPDGFAWTTPNTGVDGLDSDAVPVDPTSSTAVTDPFVLAATPVDDPDLDGIGVTDPTIDAGVVPMLSLGDAVWFDADVDGIYDADEVGAPRAPVRLLDADGNPARDASGNLVAPVETDVNGRYQFGNLLPGDYIVEFELPTYESVDPTVPFTVFVWSSSNQGDDDALDGDGVPDSPVALTARTAVITLTAAPVDDSDPSPDARVVTNPTIDMGLAPVLSLGDLVWIDVDSDGQFHPGELPIEGATVRLLDAAGEPVSNAAGFPVDPTTTDADGRYAFDFLLPGTYTVEFTLPDGYVWTIANSGNDGLDSDAVAASPTANTATTLPFVLSGVIADPDDDPSARVVHDPTIDAGVVPILSLGDLVWIDVDRDGIFGAGEQPLAGVSVTLVDRNGDIVTDADGDPILSVETDAQGRYSFESVLPGDYQVLFALPAGYAWTTPNAGDDGLDSDAVADIATPSIASTGVFTLSPNPVTDPDPAGRPVTNPTLDAGVVPVLSLGDLVWVDADGDGQYDAGELPLGGVPVRLTDADGNPVVDVNGDEVAPTVTDADGRYSFEALGPGTYRVEFELPDGYVWTVANTGNDGLDSDAAGATRDALVAVTNPFVLTQAAVIDPDADGLPVTNPTIDAGVVPMVSLGDAVWFDADGDGVYDVGEAPFAGVTVTLLDAAGNPAVDAAGNPVAPVVTDAAGRYEFDGLLPGGYFVEFTLPDGYAWSPSDEGGDDGLDSDVVAETPTSQTARTALITLTPTPVVDSDPSGDARAVTNPTIDAGVVPIVSLGDAVWVDLDGDGTYDVGEPPVAGVTVTLLDAAGNPVTDADGNVVAPVATDASGRYQFDDLLPGEYQVTFTLPAGYVWTTPNAGDDGLDSDVAPASPNSPIGTTGVFALTAAPVVDSDPSSAARSVTNPTIDAGIRPVVSVGDLVWFDVDRDGVLDQTELPAPGVTVTLLDAAGAPVTDALGRPVAPAITDVNGRYSFVDLLPGDYQIVFTLPPGAVWTAAGVGADDGLDSDAVAGTPDAPTATTGVFTLSPTPVADSDPSSARRPVSNPTLDAGLVPLVAVGDLVWRDVDRDGLQDPGEPPVPGVTVTLLDPSGAPARDANGEIVPPVVTGADGRYVFDNLLPGVYSIQFGNLPAGFQFTIQGAGGPGDSNPPATGRTPVFSVLPGDPDTRAVTAADGVAGASYINPTIDAGIFDPLVDAAPPETTTTTTRPSGSLPSTGSAVGDTVVVSLMLLGLGWLLVFASRRRGAPTA